MRLPTHICVRLEIYGRVQGFWYRAWTMCEADARGLEGWVRNRREYWVEAVFSGTESAVNGMNRICRSGLPGADVIGIKLLPAEVQEAGFTVLPAV